MHGALLPKAHDVVPPLFCLAAVIGQSEHAQLPQVLLRAQRLVSLDGDATMCSPAEAVHSKLSTDYEHTRMESADLHDTSAGGILGEVAIGVGGVFWRHSGMKRDADGITAGANATRT